MGIGLSGKRGDDSSTRRKTGGGHRLMLVARTMEDRSRFIDSIKHEGHMPIEPKAKKGTAPTKTEEKRRTSIYSLSGETSAHTFTSASSLGRGQIKFSMNRNRSSSGSASVDSGVRSLHGLGRVRFRVKGQGSRVWGFFLGDVVWAWHVAFCDGEGHVTFTARCMQSPRLIPCNHQAFKTNLFKKMHETINRAYFLVGNLSGRVSLLTVIKIHYKIVHASIDRCHIFAGELWEEGRFRRRLQGRCLILELLQENGAEE